MAKCFDFGRFRGAPHREPVPATRYLGRTDEDYAAGKRDIPMCDQCFGRFMDEVLEYNEWTPISIEPLSGGGA